MQNMTLIFVKYFLKHFTHTIEEMCPLNAIKLYFYKTLYSYYLSITVQKGTIIPLKIYKFHKTHTSIARVFTFLNMFTFRGW